MFPLPSLATHGVVADVEAARRLDGLLQVGHNLSGDPAAADQPQDGLARGVGDVGAHTGNAERGGAGIALGGPKVKNKIFNDSRNDLSIIFIRRGTNHNYVFKIL